MVQPVAIANLINCAADLQPLGVLTQKCILRTLDVNKSRTESAGHPMAAD